jgi:hypothetical protein
MNYYKEEPVLWVDDEKRKLRSSDVSDERLREILYDVHNGNGWPEFVSAKTLAALFAEAYRRSVLRADIIFLLNRWAAYWWELSDEKPYREVTSDFEYAE